MSVHNTYYQELSPNEQIKYIDDLKRKEQQKLNAQLLPHQKYVNVPLTPEEFMRFKQQAWNIMPASATTQLTKRVISSKLPSPSELSPPQPQPLSSSLKLPQQPQPPSSLKLSPPPQLLKQTLREKIGPNNDEGAGLAGLKEQMNRTRRLPQTQSQQQPQNEIELQEVNPPNINNIKGKVNEILQNKSNQIKGLMNELSPENSKFKKIGNKLKKFGTVVGEIAQEKKDEFEKAVLEILGASKGEKEAVKKAPNLMFIIIIVLLVIGGIVAVIILVAVPKINEKIGEIRNNWPEYRCKHPYSMFPSVFGPEGTTYDENKAYCDAAAANSSFGSNINPIQDQINGQNNSIENLRESVNNTQNMIFAIRDSLMKQINDIYQKMYGMFKRIAYLFKIFARLFYRIFETFNSLFKTIKYAVWTLMSVWTGPIGGLVRAFCFGCHTLIELNGKIKRLDEIVIGDKIAGDVVVGVCEFKKDSRDQYYKIGDIYVSGMHIIKNEGEFIRVHSHPRAVKVDYNLPIIRCLITDTGRLRIGENIYCDYLGDNILETYLKIVAPMVKIPFQLNDYKNSALNLYPAFTQDSIIRVDSEIKLITDIVIGDKISGKEVIGIIRYILEGKTFITEYDDGYNLCKFVGIQIYNMDKYVVRDNHRETKILGKLDCIGLVVEGGVIELNRNMRIVDFDIIGDNLRKDVEDALEKLYID
jgi:hypothetical protein